MKITEHIKMTYTKGRIQINTTVMQYLRIQNCVNEPLGVNWKTCVKFLGIYITYDVQILVEKNFKQVEKN